MNIFVLDENPRIAARMHCDKHCVKMIIEHTQMLAAAYYHTLGISRKKEIAENQESVNNLFFGFPRKHEDGSDHPYAITHVNHPCTVWTRESIENWNWLTECTKELCLEYTRRYSKTHSVEAIVDWMIQNPPKLESKKQSPFAKALPDCYKSYSVTDAYKKYYGYKSFYIQLVWNHSETPIWFTRDLVIESLDEYDNYNKKKCTKESLRNMKTILTRMAQIYADLIIKKMENSETIEDVDLWFKKGIKLNDTCILNNVYLD